MKLNSKLPKGDADGLSPLEGTLHKKPKSHVVALVILDVQGQYQDQETLAWEVTTKIRRIESILEEDREEATRFIRRAFESRTGETTLPIELEKDLESALKSAPLYEPSDPPAGETPDDAEPEDPGETVIDVPEGGYGTMTVALLTALLKKRGLDATSGKKMELVARLESNDADPTASQPKTNVVNLFGSPDDIAVDEDGDPQVTPDGRSAGEDGSDDRPESTWPGEALQEASPLDERADVADPFQPDAPFYESDGYTADPEDETDE